MICLLGAVRGNSCVFRVLNLFCVGFSGNGSAKPGGRSVLGCLEFKICLPYSPTMAFPIIAYFDLRVCFLRRSPKMCLADLVDVQCVGVCNLKFLDGFYLVSARD